MGIFLQDNTTPSGTNRNVNSVIQNNIVYGFGNAPLIWIQNQKALAGVSWDKNFYYAPQQGMTFRLESLRPRGSDPGALMEFATSVARLSFGRSGPVGFPQWQSVGPDPNGQFADPMLVNIDAFHAGAGAPYDFRDAQLKPGSPANGKGVVLPVSLSP
ncbi:MAG: hypothetical protein H7255_07165 [Ramlibacter sp.]|nr:hypothetical protein [Ramlibacter sp.]